MSHALIIDDNLVVSRAIENRLVPLGFDSFEQVWTEDQAVYAARQRLPDLVIVGDSIEAGSPINAARRITMEHEVPIIMVTANLSRARQRMAGDAEIDGPFLLNDIESTMALARAKV